MAEGKKTVIRVGRRREIALGTIVRISPERYGTQRVAVEEKIRRLAGVGSRGDSLCLAQYRIPRARSKDRQRSSGGAGP